MLRRALPLLLAACGGHAVLAPPPRADVAITDVRVFDGARALEHQTVLIAGDRVVGLGPAAELVVPTGARRVDGAGATLIPGLIDAHTHIHDAADLVDALAFGVTTEIDQMSDPALTVALGRAPRPDRAAVVPAGNVATAPGGHGTEYGVVVPTLSRPEEAEAFVAARVAEGSHHLKIVIENGDELGRPWPTLDGATAKALVVAAHAHHLIAVAHVGSAADVEVALAAGVDGLAHLPGQTLAPATVAAIARAHIFVIPTLAVLGSFCRDHGGAALAGDPRLAPLLTPEAAAGLERPFPFPAGPSMICDAPAAAVRDLAAAGVALLAGTDAPNAGTSHGVSLHGELARLVAAGLSPTAALIAATAAPARAFGLSGAGVIAVGGPADLVLVDGDPTRDIAATRALRAIWRAGAEVDLTARRAAMATAAAAAKAARASALGPIADFERDVAPRRGQLAAGSDQAMGGTSTAAIARVAGGAHGSAGALAVTGVVTLGPRGGFGGVGFVPAAEGFTPTDLRAAHRLRFWTKGDGHTYAVALFTPAGLAFQPFVAPPTWTEVTLDLAAFHAPLDQVVSISWAATTAGPFAFALDDLALE